MLTLSRMQGQGIVLETPTGSFHIHLIETKRAAERVELRLKAEWIPGHVDVTLQSQGTVKPNALAGLLTIKLQGWDNQSRGRAKIGIDAPRAWRIHRAEVLLAAEAK